jgi:hypothetical protein
MRILLLLTLSCVMNCALAQTGQLTGTIKDTSSNQLLSNAVVSLINQKDSSLVRFTRSDIAGRFTLTQLDTGKYIVLVSYPKFADFSEEVELKTANLDMGQIALTLRSKIMETVVIRSAGAVRIKGDTTEFMADSFVVKPGATVEDLLKKFPGFQVNSKGEITAQGRKVEKVLVDGEEFFGDDPTVATKNLNARAVEKVQLFDNKTDQANLTGVSTGQEGKTLNIKLKEEAKRGMFGRVEGGTDFNRFGDAKVLFNKFRKKEKISVFGTHSTIDGGSLSWSDQRKLGLDNGFEFDEAEGFYFSIGDNSDNIFSNWNIQGLPNATSAGGLYSNKWKEEKQSLNLNYRYNRLLVTNNRSVLEQRNLDNNVQYNRELGFDRSLALQNSGTGKWDWKVDSLTSFKLVVDAQRRTRTTTNTLNTRLVKADSSLINSSDQYRAAETEQMKWTNALTWKQLFRKKDRQLLTTLRLNLIEDDQEAFNRSGLQFYNNGTMVRDSTVDQRRLFDGQSVTYGVKTTYVEPLSAKFNLIGEYSFNRNNAHSYRNTYNKMPDGKYGKLDSVFSNNFDMNATVQSGSALLRYTGKKVKLTFGGGVSFTTLKLYDIDSAKRSQYGFTNFIPQVNLNFNPKPQQGININYRGSTIQPAINQLQPLRDNNDPLRIVLGNPQLDVGFNHAINLNYWQNKVLKQEYLGLGGQFNLIKNGITYNSSFDPATGRQTSVPVNVNGNYNWYFWSYYGKGFGENKWSLNGNIGGNGSRNISFINGKRNVATYTQLEFTPSVSRSKEDKYEISFEPKIGYSWTNASLQGLRNNFWIYGGRTRGMYMLPGKLRLESDVDYDVQGFIPAFGTRLSIVRWNARISKGFFKNEALRIAAVANDILNQNVGFNRTVNSSSFITESRFDRVAQYFLLRVEWSFNKNAGAK